MFPLNTGLNLIQLDISKWVAYFCGTQAIHYGYVAVAQNLKKIIDEAK